MREKFITETDNEILKFIECYTNENGYAPSIREIGEGVYMCKTNVIRHLNKMKCLGVISSTPNKARTIKIIK